MQSLTPTQQSSSIISRRVSAALLLALFFFAPHPLAISLAQSEDPKDKKTAPTPAMTAMLRPKITYRENAKYTEEARYNVTHGTMALSVVFGADGKISGVRVVSGLPYGLSETAIDAARKIRFEPAMKDGQPVSVRGILEFSFNLYDLGEGSIRRMLRNDFPLLSDEAAKEMATEIFKRGDRDSDKAWRAGQQCLAKGVNSLPQSEQEELRSLTLEAIGGLDEADQQSYQRLTEKSKTKQLTDYEEMQMTHFRFRGISRLPDEKRKRAGSIYNKTATLGIELL